MKRFPPITVHIFLLVFLSCSLLLAAEPGQEESIEKGFIYDEHLGIERPYTRLRGDALPTYAVIESFFYGASADLDPPPDNWSRLLNRLDIEPGSEAEATLADEIGGPAYRWIALLKRLGIEPGSDAEAALERAVVEARKWVLFGGPDAPPPTWGRHPPKTEEDHLVNQRLQVRHLARIYARLLVELASSGCRLDRLHAYLERDIRPGSSLTMYPDPFSSMNLEALALEETERFDELVLEALATERRDQTEDGR